VDFTLLKRLKDAAFVVCDSLLTNVYYATDIVDWLQFVLDLFLHLHKCM